MTITTNYFRPDSDAVDGDAAQKAPAGSSGAEVAVSALGNAKLATEISGPATLHGARADLHRANLAVDSANEALWRASEPVERLRRAIADHDLAQQDMAAARSADERILGDWLSGGRRGPRPQSSRALLEAERRVCETGLLADAARTALPEHEAAAQMAAQQLNVTARQRADAHRCAIISAVREYLPELIAAYRNAQECELRLADLESVVDPSLAADIRESAIKARQSLPIPPADAGRGRAFVNALLTDPSTALRVGQ